MNKRMPAYPVITHDPFFSIWSFNDDPADGPLYHWGGDFIDNKLWIDADGKLIRLIGSGSAAQKNDKTPVWEITTTRTTLTWELPGISFAVDFLTPALLEKPAVLSRPLTYVIFRAKSTDGREHALRIFSGFDAGITVAAGTDALYRRLAHKDAQVCCTGARDQNPLARTADRIKIEWGYFYAVVPNGQNTLMRCGDLNQALTDFQENNWTPYDEFSRANDTDLQGISLLTGMKATPSGCESYFAIACDDLYAVEFLQQRLDAYWKGSLRDMGELFSAAIADFPVLRQECAAFDARLSADAAAAGGEQYVFLCNAACRQAIAGHKLARDNRGNMLFFSKENDSNGCIATVDVTYPSVPLFFRYAPEFVEGMLRPIFEYASTEKWKFNFAPHDLGRFPRANGQVYGGVALSEIYQMPVEECGNMLILSAALLHYRPETTLVREYQPLLKKWAEYLLEKGYDPEKQLCTDDFAGHLAHNTNLSLKAITALAAYSRIAEYSGINSEAEQYRKAAEEFAARWVVEADDGDHYRLAFDQPGSWSLKYNLFWDKLLGFDLFPPEVAEKEIAFYKKMQNPYGVPLDNRAEYTKCDWILWTATLTGKREDFDALTEPVCRWLNEGVDRCPMSDWYFTTGEGKVCSFRARTVVGGLFAGLLRTCI
ncbi:MAG: DUF4965 domain-containing protein [Lentisphaeria bacterium]|nr:DUF4965 domain-containing protein [Lentisphaeria bacterium]